MEKMTFKTDRTSLTEGEVITVEWDCLEAERVELSIDNGYKATIVPLETAGTKRFRLNRSKGRTRLTITAWVNGKSFSKTIKVRVTTMPTTHAETVGDDYAQRPPQDGVKGWWQSLTARWRSSYQMMTPQKQLAVRLLVIFAGVILLTLVFPRMLLLGLLAVVGYLVWLIYKG